MRINMPPKKMQRDYETKRDALGNLNLPDTPVSGRTRGRLRLEGPSSSSSDPKNGNNKDLLC